MRKLVSVGDMITFALEAPLKLKNDSISGKSLDDRALVAVMIECMEMLSRRRLDCSVVMCASTQEEFSGPGAEVAAILGPLSDRLGRKTVLLGGVAFFTISCLAILLTPNIESFLFLRFLQGFGLSFITAVGYAAIQESFEERDAIKVMALMANVSLLAPLLGPVLGAFMIDHISWHWGFIGIAFLSFLSWFGLKSFSPSVLTLSVSSVRSRESMSILSKPILSS